MPSVVFPFMHNNCVIWYTSRCVVHKSLCGFIYMCVKLVLYALCGVHMPYVVLVNSYVCLIWIGFVVFPFVHIMCLMLFCLMCILTAECGMCIPNVDLLSVHLYCRLCSHLCSKLLRF